MNKFYAFINILFLVLKVTVAHAQFGKMPPFKLELSPVSAPKLPGIHSFSFAQSGSKWLFIGGRINGLHGNSSNDAFEPPGVNNNVVVIDTATWKAYSANLNQLPLKVADPLRSTNMQYYRDGDYLYMLGGYGYDSTLYDFVTFPVLSAIHVSNIIDAVINGNSIAPHIRQLKDTIPMICGGELNKIGNHYYLSFGHVFMGRYSDPPSPLFTQYYSNKIKRFKITDDGTTLKFDDFSYWRDTINFHRRDLNVLPIIKPNGQFALSAHGGVFQYTKNIPYQEPITIDASGTAVHMDYKQMMSHYTCATIPVFDSASKNMYTTFLGGLSFYNYDEISSKLICDSLVPFINDITTFTRYADGRMEETILPVQLKGLLGSNAIFIPNTNIPRFTNGVINLQGLPKTKIHIGYMFGGIKASKPNKGPSTSNDTIYRVYLTPEINSSIKKADEQITMHVYTDLSAGNVRIAFNIKESKQVMLRIVNMSGRLVTTLVNEALKPGKHEFNWNIHNHQPGIYFAVINSNQHTSSVKINVY